jgi:hypothetical protein
MSSFNTPPKKHNLGRYEIYLKVLSEKFAVDIMEPPPPDSSPACYRIHGYSEVIVRDLTLHHTDVSRQSNARTFWTVGIGLLN